MAAHFALFVDLENCGGKKSMLMDVIERVKIRGDILIGKVYGYTDSYSDLKDCLLYTSPSPRDSIPSRMPSSS